MTAMFLVALLMGLTGSLHCAGMCGPVVWLMPFLQYKGAARATAIALYQVGRISMYALLGMALHSLRAAFHPEWQQLFSIASGLLLLLAGLIYFMPQLGLRLRLPWTSAVTIGLSRVMQRRHPAWFAAAGMLNGLLPCGMVYMALAATVATQQAWQAAAVMYAFGLGTLPVMVAITLLRSRIQLRFDTLRKWTPVLLMAFGILFVLRGANLGIPMLSPKVTEAGKGTVTEIKMQCCHKP